MKHLLEIIGYLPADINSVVVLLVVLMLTSMASYGFLHRIRNEQLPFGVGSPALRSIVAWLAALPPVVLFLLVIYAIGNLF